MAIDPRISLGLQMPTIQSASAVNNIFQNNLNQAQSRAIGEQQKQINEQTIQSGQQSAQENQENRVIQLANEIAPTITSLIQNGKTDEAALTFLNHIADLQSKGLDPGGAQQMLEKLRDGESEVVLDALGRINQTARDRGLLASTQASAGQREFQNLLDIAQSDTSTELEKNSANRKLGNLARVGSSAGERTATDPVLGALVAEQGAAEAGAEAQAKSDVKINELQRIEQETESGKQAIESKRLNIDETKITNEEKRNEAINAKNARRAEADSAVDQVNSLLNGDRFTEAFGKLVTNTPDIAKSQASLDAIADVDQIKGLLTLESRQKLKGQGTISDGEQKILAQSATVLNNPLISDERARRELRKIRGVFEASSDRNQLKRETRERPTVLKFDGQGNLIQ